VLQPNINRPSTPITAPAVRRNEVDEDLMAVNVPVGAISAKPLNSSEAQTKPIMIRRRRHIIPKPFRLSSGEIRRLARRGGVRRMSAGIRETASDTLKQFMWTVIRQATTYAMHANRKTITLVDINMALKNCGRTLYY
jgi:histone H3/H4